MPQISGTYIVEAVVILDKLMLIITWQYQSLL